MYAVSFFHSWKAMFLRLSSVACIMREMDFLALSFWPALSASIFSFPAESSDPISLSSFSSVTSLAQTRMHSARRNLWDPSAFLWRTPRMLETFCCLYCMSFVCASWSCALNFRWIAFSFLKTWYQPAQALKAVLARVFSFFVAMPASTFFALLPWSPGIVWSITLALSSSCLARSSSCWARPMRARRLFVELSQSLWASSISMTSSPALTIVCLRIWALTPWSPSSMVRATSSAAPSSSTERTREVADMTSCTWSTRWWKLFRHS
mmetsp:Transcript_55897/g.126091  ORF Transcript_55897/g.126091 Transcript_55897/m.126091 type:complete len:266 (-) Transcript_55897:330-1127(-)